MDFHHHKDSPEYDNLYQREVYEDYQIKVDYNNRSDRNTSVRDNILPQGHTNRSRALNYDNHPSKQQHVSGAGLHTTYGESMPKNRYNEYHPAKVDHFDFPELIPEEKPQGKARGPAITARAQRQNFGFNVRLDTPMPGDVNALGRKKYVREAHHSVMYGAIPIEASTNPYEDGQRTTVRMAHENHVGKIDHLNYQVLGEKEAGAIDRRAVVPSACKAQLGLGLVPNESNLDHELWSTAGISAHPTSIARLGRRIVVEDSEYQLTSSITPEHMGFQADAEPVQVVMRRWA